MRYELRRLVGWLTGDREYAGWKAIDDRAEAYAALRSANEALLRDLENRGT
jgi:hypothetical protein